MKRLLTMVLTAALLWALCACGAAEDVPVSRAAEAVAPAETAETPAPAASEPPAEETVSEPVYTLPETAEGWQEVYLAFLDDNYDIFAALWPEGLSGVGFIDLDLDGMPEMLVFDLGASATLGAQLFDLVDGQVYCVSSGLDSAAGAFGEEHFSPVSICASYFDAFRLIRGEDGYEFWVQSANGTLESAWDEIIRFTCEDGGLVPVSVCGRYLESDVETGEVIAESYTVGGDISDAAGYELAAAPYVSGEDTGYQAAGMFLWDNMKRYDTTYDGFMAMAQDAATAYAALPSA